MSPFRLVLLALVAEWPIVRALWSRGDEVKLFVSDYSPCRRRDVVEIVTMKFRETILTNGARVMKRNQASGPTERTLQENRRSYPEKRTSFAYRSEMVAKQTLERNEYELSGNQA